MCAPAAVIAAVTAFAASQTMNRRQQTTPEIARNDPPAARTPAPSAMGPLDPEKRREDEEIKVSTTPKQKKDRKRVREGLKTLGAVDPATVSLPSSPDQGISV
tara:strand:+ start:157 stop:465 length:309 start_codon:yes stop_codon:yes gene_type:complete